MDLLAEEGNETVQSCRNGGASRAKPNGFVFMTRPKHYFFGKNAKIMEREHSYFKVFNHLCRVHRPKNKIIVIETKDPKIIIEKNLI